MENSSYSAVYEGRSLYFVLYKKLELFGNKIYFKLLILRSASLGTQHQMVGLKEKKLFHIHVMRDYHKILQLIV